MFRIRTRGDLIYFLVLCTLVAVMGVLLLVFPPVPLPADPSAYEQRAGALEAVTQRHAGYRSAWVRFRIANDPTIYESRAPGILESASAWVEQRTVLSFFVPRSAAGSDRRGGPQTVLRTARRRRADAHAGGRYRLRECRRDALERRARAGHRRRGLSGRVLRLAADAPAARGGAGARTGAAYAPHAGEAMGPGAAQARQACCRSP